MMQVACPVWLDTEGLHGYLLGRPANGSADSKRAARLYAKLVEVKLGVSHFNLENAVWTPSEFNCVF